MNINKSTKKENLPIQTTKNELTNFDDKSKTQQLKEVLEIVENDYMHAIYKLKKVKDNTNHQNYYKRVAVSKAIINKC